MNGYLLPSGRKRILLLGLLVLLMLLVACQDSQPTATPADEVAQATSPPSPTTRPSPSPTETPIPTATAAPSPTATATARPSPTPRPELVVLVQDEDGQPVAGALVRLVGAILARRTAGDDGRVTFMAPRSGQYRVEVTAEGYAGYVEDIEVVDGLNELTVSLRPAATATPTAEAPPTADSPPTPAPVAALPPAAQPSGPNLLVNPGFEQGATGWQVRLPGPGRQVRTYTVNDYPQFVHSGSQAATGGSFYGYFQQVSGVEPGTTYRLTMWAKMWSSTGEDRTVSENPDPNAVMYICINTNGDDDRWLPTSICSSPVRPLDVWQNLAVEAVATSDRITAILFATSSSRPARFEPLWDDAYLGLAPFGATPTPAPAGPPAPPAPVAFEAGALRDSMLGLQNALVQTGGLLDRLYNGQGATCTEYLGYYRHIVESQPYHSVPADWQGIYNEYAWAAEHGRATNEAIYSLCEGGGGVLTELNYGVARTGINESLDRLNPAIDAANSLLGQ